MSDPNVRSPSTISLKSLYVSAGTATGTSATLVLANSTASNSVLKLSSLMLSNRGAAAATASVAAYTTTSSTVSFSLVTSVSVPGSGTLVVVGRDNSLYLQEGQSLRVSASGTATIDCIGSYEEIS